VIARSHVRRIGELVGGKYRVSRFLAEGGMGAVYEAHHAVVRRPFAVKFLHAELAANREILSRFQREAEAAGALQNENVAAVLDFGIAADGTPYIVMEYLAGESLADLIARLGRLPVGRAADLCLQACRGMEAAHAAGIIHRDLKPQNLFVCRRADGTDLVKVLDFGVAKLRAVDSNGRGSNSRAGSTATGAGARTGTGMILGTPLYMSPEQARGDKTIDHRTDVYALGAILYEMVSGRKPHPGDSPNAILFHISTQPAVPLDAEQPGLAFALRTIVERALSSNPGARPASMQAFARALAPLATREVSPGVQADLTGEGGPRVRTANDVSTALAPAYPPAGAASPVPVETPRGPGSRRWSPRPRWLVAAIATVAVTVAIVLIMNGLPRRPTALTAAGRPRALGRGTSLFVPAPPTAAIQQIAALAKARAAADAALLNALVATPSAIWLAGGSPQEVQTAVHNTVVQAARRHQQVPILVAFNHPYVDCSGYGLSGAADTARYQEWIDGFASGIGNERAIVILEPSSLGHIPYDIHLDGTADPCQPTVTDTDGTRVAAPGANPVSRYAQLNYAVGALAAKAPHAVVYLDGTAVGWLPVKEIARRLVQAGVGRAQGFFVNVGNSQTTAQSIEYGTAISVRIHDAGGAAGTPFIIDTARNGRGPLDASSYAAPPYNQPAAVIAGIQLGAWCSPPGAGIGLRPTLDTGVALVDAYLWVDFPGRSAASCDILGGARAWDYTRYNPWGIGGDARNRFDPLWGMVDPAEGEWFPEQALQLAQNANPSLVEVAPVSPPAVAAAPPRPISRPVVRLKVAPEVAPRLASEPVVVVPVADPVADPVVLPGAGPGEADSIEPVIFDPDTRSLRDRVKHTSNESPQTPIP
jgi:endoglucanase